MKFLLTISLLATSLMARAASLDTLDIFSEAMQKHVRCLVILPADYSPNCPEAYPVLYLLHGWSGNFAGWLGDAPQLRQQADDHDMIMVCPDGGYDSWYLDSPVDSTVRYETHIAREVVPFIDKKYRTRADRRGRAIAGLSMGGHGAMLFAARYPDLFGAAGSMCGGLDLRPWRKNDWDLKGVLGDPSKHWANWEANSVVNMAEAFQTADVQLIIDCGLDDFFLPVNREMHQRLLDLDVPHEYTERPGEHNGDYWGSAIDFQILFFDKFFNEKK